MDEARALITGLSGPTLTDDERRFLAKARPWGAILFARNIQNPEQVTALVSEIRAALGWRAPILIDQEGGRVARLRAPHWREWESPAATAQRGAEALTLRYRLIAEELHALGIDVNCAPCIDLSRPGANGVIGDRALSDDPVQSSELGLAVCGGLMVGGVAPVIKHFPGHGRAQADSHFVLPVVEDSLDTLRRNDLIPFAGLSQMPMAMTAHIRYPALTGDLPFTLSATGIATCRRLTGFDGLLMTDDIEMKALTGPMADRCRDAIAAGCDLVLHCSGDLGSMEEAAAATPTLEGKAAKRAGHALEARAKHRRPLSPDAWERWERMVAEPAHA